MSTTASMETLVSLCKRRGFIYQSSEIYGGLASAWVGALGSIIGAAVIGTGIWLLVDLGVLHPESVTTIAWLALFAPGEEPVAALGDRHPASLPDADEELRFVHRVKRITAAPVLAGGCG